MTLEKHIADIRQILNRMKLEDLVIDFEIVSLVGAIESELVEILLIYKENTECQNND